MLQPRGFGSSFGLPRGFISSGNAFYPPDEIAFDLWLDNDGAVSNGVWNDTSGNSNNYTEITSPPTLTASDPAFNNKASYNFTSSTQLNATSPILLEVTANAFFCAVVETDGTILFRDSVSGIDYIRFQTTSIDLLIGAVSVPLVSGVDLTTKTIVYLTFTSGIVRIYLNGGYYGQVDLTSYADFNIDRIISAAAAADRKLAQVGIIKDAVPTLADQNRILNYLASQYGVTPRIPITNAFTYYFPFELA